MGNTVETGKNTVLITGATGFLGEISGKASYKGIPGPGNGKEPGTGEET